MMAVAFSAAALQAALGAAGTLVVVVLFVIFGAPASGGTVPTAFLPWFWRTFGPYLPAGAGTTVVRNTIYFGANDIAQSLLILAAYLVVGALGVIAIRKQKSESNAVARGRGVDGRWRRGRVAPGRSTDARCRDSPAGSWTPPESLPETVRQESGPPQDPSR